jgi:fam49b protein
MTWFLFLLLNLDAQPTASEKEIYLIVEDVLLKAQQILHQLQTYKGAGNEIREVSFDLQSVFFLF